MVQIIKCPNCGANMTFNSDKQMMYCEYCQTELSVDEVKMNESDDNPGQEDSSSSDTDEFAEDNKTAKFKVYKCPSCGAELLTDEYTSATFCNFCGNSSLIEDRLEDELMPAQLIPFKINKDMAKNIYREWTKKGALTPKSFRLQSTIEKISGIYVPFWLYDYHTRAKIDAMCTRVRREVRGNTELIHTDNFKVVRDIEAEYLKVPADASIKMPDDVMDKLEPFHYNDMLDFEMPYLSGFSAEKYNYDSTELASRIETRINDYVYNAARNTIMGYSTVNVVNQDTHLKRKAAKYTLFPVWLLNYRYNGENYLFAINGQTGKIVGNLPISKGRSFGWFIGITAVCFIILMLVGRIFG